MRDALVFAVSVCRLRPHCVLEVNNGGTTRIDKIVTLIRDCRWGIHDISRTELNAQGLPRFNMPLELGPFLDAHRFGDASQREKSCLVLDREPFRFQTFISDVAGQDIVPHGDQPDRAIAPSRRCAIGSPPSCGNKRRACRAAPRSPRALPRSKATFRKFVPRCGGRLGN